jgi:SAM-dependent methyltransferase
MHLLPVVPRFTARARRGLLATLVAFALPAQAAEQPKDAGPYVPSPQSVVSDMLKLAEVGPKDFVIDLGSGDGRIVLTAAKVFGARGFGVEIKDELVKLSNDAAQRDGLADRVRFMKQDLFKTDISQATVLTMYLLPDTVNLLREKLIAELRPGTRVISHDYPLSGWIPERYVHMDLEDKVQISGVTTTLIYLYVVPANVVGTWRANVPAELSREPLRLKLKQQYTRVSGKARIGAREVELEEVKLRGDQLSFKLAARGRSYAFSGIVGREKMVGTVNNGRGEAHWSAALSN